MNAYELIGFLTKQDPSNVRIWLSEAWEGIQTIPEDFNWKHLAAAMEVLAKQGPDASSIKPNREWTKIITSIFEYLISNTIDPEEKRFFQKRLVELKAYCIAHLGSVEGDDILDARNILKCFKNNNYFTLDEVEKKILFIKDLDFMEIAYLLDLKERLLWLQWLWDKGQLEHEEELAKWLAIRQKLL